MAGNKFDNIDTSVKVGIDVGVLDGCDEG